MNIYPSKTLGGWVCLFFHNYNPSGKTYPAKQIQNGPSFLQSKYISQNFIISELKYIPMDYPQKCLKLPK